MPLFILSTLRGTIEDPRTYQVAQGLIGPPYLAISAAAKGVKAAMAVHKSLLPRDLEI